MANTFDQQARERFTASLKFMATAEALLEDDLIYRSALADAVSAIKNMLQGYLLLRIANTPASGVTQQWQETAASNRMPDLIAACSEAGLDLRGLAVDIRRLNNERNNRAHDDPQRQIEAEQASHAIETARTLQRRIKAAVEGKAETRSLPAMATQAVHVARAAVSGQLARKESTASRAAARAAPAGAEGASAAAAPGRVAAAASETTSGASPRLGRVPVQGGGAALVTNDASGGEDEGARDTDEMVALAPRRKRQRAGRASRAGRVLWRALLAATLVLAGIVIGGGLAIPVARGDAPAWLSFATNLLPPAPTPRAAATPATPTATPAALNTSQSIGALAIGPVSCAVPALLVLPLANTGVTPVRWALASSDTPGVRFATSATAVGDESLAGTLAPGAHANIYVRGIGAGSGHVALVASGGAALLALGGCGAGG